MTPAGVVIALAGFVGAALFGLNLVKDTTPADADLHGWILGGLGLLLVVAHRWLGSVLHERATRPKAWSREFWVEVGESGARMFYLVMGLVFLWSAGLLWLQMR